MSTTPADPPPPQPIPAATGAARDGAAAAPPPPFDWTTAREVRLECAGCGARYVLSYKYRFAEGLAATRLRCPSSDCRRAREFYLPVNAFDVVIALAPDAGGSAPAR
jgi:hypothetical protein